MTPTIPILVGPTASGKTALVLALARTMPRLEVVSADSRQVYRKLDIGTAKPTPAERAQVPHHLIDFLDPSETYSAGRFRADAERAIAECLVRGSLPIIVGGTGLYLRALAEGLSPIPHVSQEITRRLREELAAEGLAALYRRLRETDPKAASHIKPSDPQRTIRALAVHESTGKPLSAWWELPPASPEYAYAWLGVRWPRGLLRERIRQRTQTMLEAGLEREVRGLLAAGYPWETNALRTVGYREWRPFIEGERGTSLEEVREQIVIHTAQYAKRQMTWFAAEPQIHWLEGQSGDLADRASHWIERVRTS